MSYSQFRITDKKKLAHKFDYHFCIYNFGNYIRQIRTDSLLYQFNSTSISILIPKSMVSYREAFYSPGPGQCSLRSVTLPRGPNLP